MVKSTAILPEDFATRWVSRVAKVNSGIVWYYFLIASPEGDQLLATYTLAEDHMQEFGEQDLLMIGSLQWQKQSQPESLDGCLIGEITHAWQERTLTPLDNSDA